MRMDTPLFIDEPKITFPKVKHASAQLSEDHSKWGQEILNNLFKTVPEASEYTPTVSMIEANEEQGYGIGVIIIKSKPDTAMSASMPNAKSGIKQAVVPFFIKNFMLLPLDIIIVSKGRMTPLTGERLREALFKPQTFSLMTQDWGDQSLYNIFYPPGRGSNDFASGVSTTASGSGANYVLGPGMKYSMLDTIGPSLSDGDVEKVAAVLTADPSLIEVMKHNEIFAGAMKKISSYEGQLVSGEEALQTAVDAAPIHVVQFGYENGRYWVKTASRRFFYDKGREYLTRKEMIEKVGEEATAKADTEGTVTVSDVEAPPPMKEDDSQWEVVTRSGIYKVRTSGGKELVGWVIPSLLDFDGHSVPMTVFTNGATAAVQDEVLGSHVAAGVNLPNDDPGGTGVFYMSGENGVQATVPVTVVGTEEATDGATVLLVKTLTGGSYRLKQVPGLKKMLPSEGEGTVMVPDGIKFMSLSQELPVPLVSRPGELNKTASDLNLSKVTIFGDGLGYGMRFQMAPNLEASMPKRAASVDDVVWMLCLGGHGPQEAHQLAKQAQQGFAEAPIQDIRLARDIVEPALEKAKHAGAEVGKLRRNLLKEAAVLPDIQTVDSVLSLGFINPENIRTFVSRLPYLEKALSQVCELALAARMGLTEVPEFAAARAARGLDDVIQGLKALAMREVNEEGS